VKKKKKKYSAVGEVVKDSVGLGIAGTVSGALGVGTGSTRLLGSAQTMASVGTLLKSAKGTTKQLKELF